MIRSTATLQKPETKYDKNYYDSTMEVFERRKNISRLACKYLSLINDVVERNDPDLERMLDLHKKIFDLNEIELEKMNRKIGPTRGKCEVQKVAYQKDKGSMTHSSKSRLKSDSDHMGVPHSQPFLD